MQPILQMKAKVRTQRDYSQREVRSGGNGGDNGLRRVQLGDLGPHISPSSATISLLTMVTSEYTISLFSFFHLKTSDQCLGQAELLWESQIFAVFPRSSFTCILDQLPKIKNPD